MLLRKNPITMAGRIDRCWLFAYRAPLETIRPLVPAPLEPVTHEGWGFFNLVVCRIERMRPLGVPAFAGIGYRHAAYRIPVRAPVAGVEGLYFLRSDCDSRPVALLGRMLTDFRFHHARIAIDESPERVEIAILSKEAPARAVISRRDTPSLAPGSPFATLEEAARLLDYKPFGISLERDGRLNVVAIGRDESARKARPVAVSHADWRFLEGKNATLEVCWEVEPIEYRWNRGRIVGGDMRRR